MLPPLSDAEVAEHVARIARDGYAILPDAIPPDFRQEICDELDRLESVRPGGDIPPAPFTGQVTRRWFDLLNDGEVWQGQTVGHVEEPWGLFLFEPLDDQDTLRRWFLPRAGFRCASCGGLSSAGQCHVRLSASGAAGSHAGGLLWRFLCCDFPDRSRGWRA